MHFSRKLILLAAFMVGLGFIGTGEVEAAKVTKVQITAPDSGALVGIGESFTVRVEVEDFLGAENDSMGVIVFLSLDRGGEPDSLVADTSATGLYPEDSPTEIQTLLPGGTDFFETNTTEAQAGGLGIGAVAALQLRGRAIEVKEGKEQFGDGKNLRGDGTSLKLLSADNEGAVFEWVATLHPSVGTVSGVRAGAVSFVDVRDTDGNRDGNANDDNPTSDEASTAATAVYSTERIDLDGDRPDTGDMFFVQNLDILMNRAEDFVPFNEAQDADSLSYRLVGERPGDSGGGREVTGFNVGGPNDTRTVLGIGDTLRTYVKLGNRLNSLLGSDSLKLVIEAFGIEQLVHQRGIKSATRKSDRVEFEDVISNGEYVKKDSDFTDLFEAAGSDTHDIHYFLVDKAGNRSDAAADRQEDVLTATGISIGTVLLVDSAKPVFDSTNGDTLLPVSAATSTDGGINGPVYPNDWNPIRLNLDRALDSLIVEFKGPKEGSLRLGNAGIPSIKHPILKATAGASTSDKGELLNFFSLDFTSYGKASGLKDDDDAVVAEKDSVRAADKDGNLIDGQFDGPESKDAVITTGTYKISFTGIDVAGNKGPARTRSDVYVDVDDVEFIRSFPFGEGDNESGLDTIEANTAVVVFRLSEPVDSLAIEYKGVAMGADADSNDVDKTRNYLLVGGQKTNTTTPEEFRVPGLQHDNRYVLTVTARDLAGNWVQSKPDTFWYNTDYQVPQANQFVVKITKPGERKTALTGLDKLIEAGDEIGISLEAQAVSGDNAPTYGGAATVTVGGGSGIELIGNKSTGATDNGDGTISLNGEDWVIGSREIVFRDTVSVENLTISIEADDDSTLVGEADSVVVIHPDDYSQILVSAADDSVMQGENFMVNVVIADKFGNQRVADNRFVAISPSTIGVQVPPDAVHIAKGAGSFPVNSSGWSGDLTISVRDIAGDGVSNTLGTAALYVRASDDAPVVDPDPEEAPDAPDQLVAEDYAGASGEGDQGGFVLLTWDASDDHDSLDKYRVYRQIAVSTVMDEETGNFVTLEEPTTALVHWGTIDAIPGADVMRVVVATLDSDATAFGVAAERGGRSSKQAFGPGQNVENPYELMAQTMSRSREAAQPVSDAPVFATLSPEALTYQAKGVVPLLKSVDSDVLRSEITKSEVVRSIDNIPPGAIPYLKVLDTPGDAGGSIRVTWTTSPDDRMLTTTVGSAIGLGGHVYSVGGVAGYNVYRKIGDGAFELIGKAGSGETSFDDATVFNGVRYTYQVKPYDIDNETDSELEGTAMAIRNQVLDANGNVVLGLFGSDDKVGFDDFFILADQFGMTVEDEDFEPAFDLSPNNKIDLNDFFTFADFFGRTVEGAGKALPISMAGLNSDARFYLDAGTELPRVGEEMAILVSLEDFVELKGYGFSVSYDPQVLTYVGTRVENSILGAGEFAEGQLVSHKDGLVSLVTYGDVATEGDLGLSLLFRSLQEIEDSYIDIVNAEVRDGNYGLNTLATPVSVRIQTRPEVYALRNNFPNPFNPETTLKYDLPEAGDVKLEVYNMLGQVVRTLVNEHQTAGRYAVQWDATNGHGQSMSSGIYFYRVQVEGEFTDVKKMLLLK